MTQQDDIKNIAAAVERRAAELPPAEGPSDLSPGAGFIPADDRGDKADFSSYPGPGPGEYAILKIKRASNGQHILYCTADPAPAGAIEEARRLGLPLFTPAEIPHVKAATTMEPGYIEKIIEVKLSDPGAFFCFWPFGFG